MSQDSAPAPDLAAILRSLSSYSAPAAASPSLAQPQTEELEGKEYDPSEIIIYPPANTDSRSAFGQASQCRPGEQSKRQVSRPTTNASAATCRPGPVVPSSEHITRYPQALLFITIHLVPRQDFLPRVRHLIQTQRSHERTWAENRKTLEAQLQARGESKRRLDAVLASVTGKSGNNVTPKFADDGRGKTNGPESMNSDASETVARSADLDKDGEAREAAQELQQYDRKVYAAQRDMIRAAERELDRLNVPFFHQAQTREPSQRLDPEQRQSNKNQAERRESQLKVIALLEDLCAETT